MRIRAAVDFLLVIGDPISEKEQSDAMLQGLLKEYNPFIMMIYSKGDPTDIYDVEALLYIQEAQLDKYRQELASLNVTANVAQKFLNSKSTKNSAFNPNGH